MGSRFGDILKMLGEGRIGFQAEELMTGTHQFLEGAGPAGEHPLEFRVIWGAKNLLQWLNPSLPDFMTNFLYGTVSAGGLVENAECRGVLELRYFTEAKIRYRFDFQDRAGRRYRYLGEKVNIHLWTLPKSHTTCYGTITDLETGRDISRSVVYFRWSTLPAFLKSFRLA